MLISRWGGARGSCLERDSAAEEVLECAFEISLLPPVPLSLPPPPKVVMPAVARERREFSLIRKSSWA